MGQDRGNNDQPATDSIKKIMITLSGTDIHVLPQGLYNYNIV